MKKMVAILLVCLSLQIDAQSDSIIRQHIDSLSSNLELTDAYNSVYEAKLYVDFKYYSLAFKTIPLIEDKLQRIIRLNEIHKIPYFLFDDKKMKKVARKLYVDATKLLIKECRCELEVLNNIEIHPAFQSVLSPYLKDAIEYCGGKWDRGEIPSYQPSIPIGNTLIKTN